LSFIPQVLNALYKKMSFNNFVELQDLIRSYNSKSILEIGTRICYKIFYSQNNSDPLIRLSDNAKRGYAIRIMLLASMGNPHRRKNIDEKTFHTYIDDYYNFENHTIAYPNVLDQEAETIFRCIQTWEVKEKSKVRNWLLKLSDIFDITVIRQYMLVLFLQRQAALQNEGFGQPIYRVHRTIKFIELLESRCNENFRGKFFKSTGLSLEIYFKQFLGCIGLFTMNGYCDFSKFPDMNIPEPEYGITNETLKLFIQQNSTPFHSESETSFCGKVIKKLQNTPEFYKPFFYNFFLEKPFVEFSKYQFYLLDPLSLTESCWNQVESLISEYETSTFCRKVIKKLQNTPEFYKPFFYNFFLEKPFIELSKDQFYLPDPLSLPESCWNQVKSLILENWTKKERGNILSSSFEEYLEKVLLPSIAQSFKKIPEVENSKDPSDKRADFLIELSQFYIVLECKNSLMSLDTSNYFDPEGIAGLWCRTHLAVEQIAATVKALDIKDKPVIPLVLTFYDSIASSALLTAMIKNSDYCGRMDLKIPPIVYSLHEFEHRIFNRSFDNWAELILQTHNNPNVCVEPDNQGHNYQHLADIQLL
jgi:hypothetical protein